jgi:hypothetical protein
MAEYIKKSNIPKKILSAERNTYIHVAKEDSRNNAQIAVLSRINRPMRRESLIARRQLSGRWNMYSTTDHPLRPVGYEQSPASLFNKRLKLRKVSDYRFGYPKKIAANLSLSEVFKRMKNHEDAEKCTNTYVVSGSKKVAETRVEIVRPVEKYNYWRNIAKKP